MDEGLFIMSLAWVIAGIISIIKFPCTMAYIGLIVGSMYIIKEVYVWQYHQKKWT